MSERESLFPDGCTCDPNAFELGPEGQRRYFDDRFCPYHGEVAQAHVRLREVVREWLAETDEADEDDPGLHDYYGRVGARWGKGNFYSRFKDALDGIH